MNREQLKELELSSDQINKIMGIYGKSVKGLQKDIDDKEQELSTVQSEKTKLEGTAKKVETLQADYDALKETNDELNQKLSDNDLDKRILKVVSKEAHDPDDIFKFIDKDKFEYDEESGEITNFDDVIGEVKEGKPYLFNVVDTNDGKGSGDDDGADDKSQTKDYSTNKQKGNNKGKPDLSQIGKDLAAQIHGKQEE